MSTQVAPQQRFTASHPCPICGGHAELPRGRGERCAGFLSADGELAHCSREEFAGGLPAIGTSPPTFAHRLNGECRCARAHSAPAPWSRRSRPARRRRLIATYPYQNAEGRTLYRVCRFEPKSFAPQHPREDGGWEWGLKGVPRVLYRLPELLAAPGRVRFVVEGEKDADRLAAEVLIATTNAGGADGWHRHAASYTAPFAGCPLAVVLPDNDAPGRGWAQEVAASVNGIGCPVRVVELPGLPEHGDVSDWLDLGNTINELKSLVKATPPWQPGITAPHAESSKDHDLERLSPPTPPSQPAWPEPLDEAAFLGLAGDVVRGIDPHTEADPVAVLVSFLVGFGNAASAAPHAEVGATNHPPRTFVALVGETSRARKGDSWSAVRRLLATAAPDWASTRIQGGLSSGEGLIAAVRDSEEEVERKTGETRTVDGGVADKRLLVVEGELARTLRAMHREGNTLSAIVRDAWDTGDLRVMTKSQLRATGAHISIIGHITTEELKRELDETSLANGFANRFLWLAVRRSKLLPRPRPFTGPDVAVLAQRIRTALDFARKTDTVARDADADDLWDEVYPELTADEPGMLGALLARTEAHAVRFAVTYALLDLSPVVRREHLMAALALLDYAKASVAFIFGDRLGDPVADAILRAVDERGQVTRTEISALFGRHVSSGKIEAALASLVRAGPVVRESRETGGRPAELWRRRDKAEELAKEAKEASGA